MERHISLMAFLIFIGVIIIFVSCGEESHSSYWKKAEILVDGDPDDWSDYPLEIYEKDNLRMAIGLVNNDSSMNIMFRFHDGRLAGLFSRRGVILWLNGESKKTKNLGILYVDKNAQQVGMPPFEEFSRPRAEMQRDNKAILFQGVFSLIHNNDTTDLKNTNSQGYFADAGYEKGAYCFEFEFPLVWEENFTTALSVSDNNMIKLGIEILPVSEAVKERMEEMREKRKQAPPGGFGRPEGGMKGSEILGGPPRMMKLDLDGKEIWLNVQLARSPLFGK